MRGSAYWGICSAHARARTRAGALQRARHRDGEVAAAEFGQDGVARGGVEERRQLWRDAWEGHVKLEVAGWPRAAVAAPLRRRSERKQEGRLEVEGSGLVCNFRNSRDPTVKLK